MRYWSRDGKELFYMAVDKQLMAVEATADSSSFQAGIPRALFQTHARGLAHARNYYVASGDGKRFLVITPVEENLSCPINVVLNWTANLHH